MKNKSFPLILALIMILGVGFVSVNNAEAQSASFPDGCGSALGYSRTTGQPCNGTNSTTMGPLPGCTTALGYSASNGAPCSGSAVAIFYLAGCTSVNGYSAESGEPCNGTSIATSGNFIMPPSTPGLPMTGDGGNTASNLWLLAISGLTAVFGSLYVARSRFS